VVWNQVAWDQATWGQADCQGPMAAPQPPARHTRSAGRAPSRTRTTTPRDGAQRADAV